MKKGFWWLGYLIAIAFAVGLAITPYFFIGPAIAQTPDDLAFVYNLNRWAPYAILILLVASLLSLVTLWRKSGGWGRLFVLLFWLPMGFATWLAFSNPYELMFRPLPEPSFARTEAVDFLADEDLVLAVTLGDDAAAYPLRQLGHHHIVHDVVNGVPIAVTY